MSELAAITRAVTAALRVVRIGTPLGRAEELVRGSPGACSGNPYPRRFVWSGWVRRSGSCRASRLHTHGCGTAPEFDRLLREPSRQGADHTEPNDVKRDAPKVGDRQLVSVAKLAEVEGA